MKMINQQHESKYCDAYIAKIKLSGKEILIERAMQTYIEGFGCMNRCDSESLRDETTA